MFRTDGDIPVARECLSCGHEFHIDVRELTARRPTPCPKCGSEVPYSPQIPGSEAEPQEF
jgi:DNA-directed RNA polymerase subunit RPC12/RpoP